MAIGPQTKPECHDSLYVRSCASLHTNTYIRAWYMPDVHASLSALTRTVQYSIVHAWRQSVLSVSTYRYTHTYIPAYLIT